MRITTLLLLSLSTSICAFYLPGVAPHDYTAHYKVDLTVNALTSERDLLPFDYYYEKFHFCPPKEGKPDKQRESLGAILFGDRLYKADFELRMLENVTCSTLCEGVKIPAEDAKFINDRIAEEYQQNWFVDGLPAGQQLEGGDFAIGFDLGFEDQFDRKYLNNHFDITLQYHSDPEGTVHRIVGFLIDAQSIINSIVIVFMLTGMIGMILLRALHKDISRYNSFGDEDGGQEDFGWKLVHADVFRPPAQRMLLSVLLGNGAQLFLMAAVTLVFAVLGFLSPSSRGSLSTVTLIFYLCFACAAGYVSARVYKMLQGEYWRRNVVLTATLVPGTVFFIFIILNFFLVGAQSSAAVPFGTMFALVLLWFLVSLPLCMIGAYVGFKAPPIQNPVKTNQIPRQIPPQPTYLNKYISALIGGILPFGAIFIEVYFIMKSIWSNRIYYVFGFLSLVFVILVITCSEVAILMCYFHLCSEDYYWSWRAFMTAGATGFYVFVYSIMYYSRWLSIDNWESAVLYFGWSLVMSMLFTILTGAVGYFAALTFVRKIFASIKVD
ncbi:hypothetical protein HK104_005769 [Borealophlyctis nickersoniae]|nr:hypothetical protein HK104_005769 [Borealophlyctis nickersoniae]